MKKLLISFFLFSGIMLLAGCKEKDDDDILVYLLRPDGKYDLNVDTNRDGVVDTGGTEDFGESNWNASHGAVMVYNNDDDDSDTSRDHANTEVDGTSDEPDLAEILVKQIADIGAGSYATIGIDTNSAGYVRLFKHDGVNWNLFTPGVSTISDTELAAGNVLLGIESCHYAETAGAGAGLWNGETTLALSVRDAGNKELGSDKLVLRTAPFLLHSNLDYPERIYICQTADNSAFVSDMTSVASTIGIPLTVINNADRWTQDQFEIGFVDRPTGNNPVVLNSPRNPIGSTLINYAWNYMLGPDFGCLQYGSDSGESLNSFGNLDCMPPTRSYPLGRVIVGGAGSRRMEQEIRDFLSAQAIQGPVYELDTTWLAVGHVDEIMSFMPATNSRGWVVAWADVDCALDILESVPSGTPVFAGTGDDTTAGAILADAVVMDVSDQVQSILDTLRGRLKMSFGLKESDFVRIPVLWDIDPYVGSVAAYTAGAVNCIVVRPNVIVAKQHGPEQAAQDLFELDITNKLAALGLTAYFVEDWSSYHVNLGEVHCGSNVLRTPPATPKWWTTGR